MVGVISVNFLHQLTLHVEITCNNRLTTPFNTIWSLLWFFQQQSYLRFYLPFWFYLIIPLCTTDRPLLATHPMIWISWKRPAMNLSFFYFLEESWFWTEGERGWKQADKRISFQSLCLDLQLKFDQYLSLICVCIYSSRFCESFKPFSPLNLGTKNRFM